MSSIESAYKDINRELEKISEIKDSNGNIIDVESIENNDSKVITTNVINDKLDQILKNRAEKERAKK